MSFQLTHEVLVRIAKRSSFKISSDEMVFFGLRGCLPVNPEDHESRQSHELDLAEVNYVNPRCAIVQWLPAEKKLAVFPASTCPNQKSVITGITRGGEGVNQLITGYYSFYKGMHLSPEKFPSLAHKAFKQNEERVVLRTSDDADYDFDDRPSTGNQSDNLHSARCGSISGSYSSLGCQVVVGMWTAYDGSRKESGPWKTFRSNAYALDQKIFPYVLVDGWEVRAAALSQIKSLPALVRFGSTGPLVSRVQHALLEKNLISFSPDGQCGPRTTEAIIAFQKKTFGAENTDAIVGPGTALALGIDDWPDTDSLDGLEGGTTKTGGKPKVGAAKKWAGKTEVSRGGAISPAYYMPAYAQPDLGVKAGVPWSKAIAREDLNTTGGIEREGLVKNSVFTFPATDGKTFAVYFESKFAIDGDGVGGNDENDPVYQAETSLRNADGSYFNSRKQEFIVLPLPPRSNETGLQDLGVGLGDVGVILFKNGELLPVIFGDHGPRLRLGEGSMAAAKKLGINPDPNIGGLDAGEIPPGVVHLVFPGSAELSHIDYFKGTKLVKTARTKLDGNAVIEKTQLLLGQLRSMA